MVGVQRKAGLFIGAGAGPLAQIEPGLYGGAVIAEPNPMPPPPPSLAPAGK